MICSVLLLFFFLVVGFAILLRMDIAMLIIAANACILGPATAAAMAAGMGWRDLVTPGLLAGVLGYSIATFVGVAVSRVLI